MILIVKYIPNCLSLIRILCAPVFFCFRDGEVAVCILILAGLTDFLDGYVARKFNVESRFGQILDPLADKIFCNTALWSISTITEYRQYILWAAIVLTLRDAILVIGGMFINFRKSNADISPILISKICTVLIILLCGMVLIPGINLRLIQITSILSVVCVLYTGYRYAKRYIRPLSKPS
ncbi:MAG: CDP-alcohol phosphatidyltransferase family protein [Holosporales bacterium]|nr:CDP-alcohol phosphatidyltransferase family protein [Holosporales bacterium]